MAKTTTPSGGRAAGEWAVVAFAALAAYAPALRGGFVWDDDAHVTKAALRSVHGLWRIWFSLGATQQYYPVLHSAFWVEHRLWGDFAFPYHLLNILLHATAAWLLAIVLRRLARGADGAGTGGCLDAPLLAGLLFALHPVCVESVAWISEQKNTLSAVFYLLAALGYLHWEERRSGFARYFLALALFVAALLSKSVTATLPAALLVVIWWRRGSLSWRRDVYPLLPFLAAGAAAGLFTAWVERRYIGAQGAAFELGGIQRCLLAGHAIGFYLGKLLWPSNLMFVYPRWNLDAGEWAAYLYPLGAIALLAGLWSIRGRRRGPLAAALFFAGTLFPALGFFNVYPFVFSYVADHFQYLASMGVFALAAGAWQAFARHQARRAGDSRPESYSLLITNYCFPILVLLLLASLTWRACYAYRDVETLYRTSIRANPDSWMPRYNLGVVLAREGRIPEAIASYERAATLDPDRAEIRVDLGTAYARAGRVPEAIAQFQAAVRLRPDFADAHLNLGAALRQAGRLDEGIAQCVEALRINGDYPEANFNLGVMYQEAGRLPEAIAQFGRALKDRPDFSEAGRHLAAALGQDGVALAQLGRLAEARSELEEAARLLPGDMQAHYNLGLVLRAMGREADARLQFEESERLGRH